MSIARRSENGQREEAISLFSQLSQGWCSYSVKFQKIRKWPTRRVSQLVLAVEERVVQLQCQVPEDQKMAKEKTVSQLVLVVEQRVVQLQCQVPEDQTMAKEKRVSQLVLVVERRVVQ